MFLVSHFHKEDTQVGPPQVPKVWLGILLSKIYLQQSVGQSIVYSTEERVKVHETCLSDRGNRCR